MSAAHDIKDLLEKAKDVLISSGQLIDVDDADIYIAESLDVIPTAAKFPCVAVKDGEIRRNRISDWVYDAELELHVGVYQLLKSGEDATLATSPQTTYGVLDLVVDIRSVLDDNYLGIDGIYMQSLPDEGEIELLDAGELAVLRKIITWTYTKRVIRSTT